MACRTLLFIAQKCKVQLCNIPTANPVASGQIALAEYIVNTVPQVGAHGAVSQTQMLLLYQAIGYSLSGFIDPAHLALQQTLITKALELPTDAINVYFGFNKTALRAKDAINGIVRAIQIHAAVAAPLRSLYSHVL